jgi:predicted ATPase
VAQWAAALGREFTHELLTAVVPYDPESLDRDLAQLVRAEILFLQEAHGGGCAYRFKHALIQDAAYESLLRSQRQQYHLRIATVLEMRFPETGRSQPELLAHHYTEAAVPDRAVPYWQAAGERSLARSAHREAIGHLERARDQLAALPAGPERHRREIKLLVLLGAALTATRGYGVPEVEEAYTRARDLSREWGEVEELFRAQYGLWRLHMLRADYAVSRAQGEELLRLAREARNPSFLVAAHRALGGILFYMGALDECREHLLEVITGTPDDADGPNSLIQDVYDVVDPRVSCRSYHAWSLWLSGRPDEALAESERAIALARSLDHPFSIALALSFGTWLRQFRGEVRETLELARAALEISTEQGFLFWIGWARVLEGWALAQEGACEQSCEEGLARIRQGLEEWATRGSALGRSYFLALRAEVCLDCGRLEEAAESLTEARAFAAATGERYWLPELDRLRGRMHALEGDTDAAADAYRSAAAAARAHQFPALEVRALASLEELEARAG